MSATKKLKLFTPVQLGPMQLKHRVVMAPLTRSRSIQPNSIPGSLMTEYYAQRASEGGFILGEAGQTDAALRFYDQALGFKPDFLVALSNSGKLLFSLRRFDEALAAFDKAIAIAPTNADYWNSRAGALRELGRWEESLAACQEAMRLRPNFA